MSTTWEDVQQEIYYDRLEQEFQQKFAEENIETIAYFIGEGFTNSETESSSIFEELKKQSQNPISMGMLSSSLLEIIERETFCLPILVSGLGIDPDNPKSPKVAGMKKLLSKSVNSANFVCNYFCSHFDEASTLADFDNLINTNLPTHSYFKKQSSLKKYREDMQTFRNGLMHGRKIASTDEARHFHQFIDLWREKVLNEILLQNKLQLSSNWVLEDI